MDFGQVAMALQGELTLKQSKARLANLRGRQSPSVPQPAGQVGQDPYWLCTNVEQWRADNPELVGASRKDLIRATRVAHGHSVAKGVPVGGQSRKILARDGGADFRRLSPHGNWVCWPRKEPLSAKRDQRLTATADTAV